MSFRKLILLLAAISVLAVSCEDDEETSVKPSLQGVLKFSVQKFIAPGQTLTMTPEGLTHPDEGTIGYYWKVTPTMTKYDTTRFLNGLDAEKDGKPSDGSFTHKFSDTLKTYTVHGYAFAEGYTGTSSSSTVTAVKGGLDGSVQGTGILSSDKKVTVDGVDYHYVRVGNLYWFMSNLSTASAGGAPYAGYEVMSDVFGRYYSYDEAVNACPQGWRLPTSEEWDGAASEGTAAMMCDASFNGEQMWEYWPEVGEITNSTRLAVISAGYANLGQKADDGTYPSAAFEGLYEYAAFWTADEADEPGTAYYRYMVCDQPELFVMKGNRESFGASVRCVKDVE